ncbi:hypothetical protein AX16_007716 [Volvariella volvacea WC 439]|nr:hypothetical protein AX16_007716 [Volvariella volvacea WC 439]
MRPASVNDLPPELLSEIFSFHRLDVDPLWKLGHWREIPLNLGLVCKRWRFITLDTRTLWTYIRIHGQANRIARYIPFINRWLARSKTLPCEVDAEIWVKGNPSRTPLIMRRILLPVISRTRVLNLALEFDDLQECMRIVSQGSPLLQTLNLSLSRELSAFSDMSSLPSLSLNFSSCPKVESVTISRDLVVEFLTEDSFIGAFPPSITHFNHNLNLRPHRILNLLSRCRNLIDFHLHDRVDDDNDWSETLPENMEYRFSHTSIRNLGLTFRDVGIMPLFKAIKFPALRCLKLSGFVEPQGVLGLIADAEPPLEVLHLEKFEIGVDELLGFFRRVPALKDLELLGCGFLSSNTLISRLVLTPEATTSHYLPNLKKLHVGCDVRSEEAVNTEELITFIESRWRVQVKGFARLDHIEIHDQRELEGEWYKRVLLMRTEGMYCRFQGMLTKEMQSLFKK